MILATLNLARRIDLALRTAAGHPYYVIISIGLILEIIEHVRQLHEAATNSGSLTRSAVTIIFCVVLLLNQLGELSERIDKRRGDGRLGRRRT